MSDTTTSGHLKRLSRLLDDDLLDEQDIESIGWAFDALSRLTIDRALRLARDEGKRACNDNPRRSGAFVFYDEGDAMIKHLDIPAQLYVPTINDCLATWEVIPDAKT